MPYLYTCGRHLAKTKPSTRQVTHSPTASPSSQLSQKKLNAANTRSLSCACKSYTGPTQHKQRKPAPMSGRKPVPTQQHNDSTHAGDACRLARVVWPSRPSAQRPLETQHHVRRVRQSHDIRCTIKRSASTVRTRRPSLARTGH